MVLNALLKAHPDLVVEAEALATRILDNAAWESIGDEVEHALRLLPLKALGARVGYHPGRGYTHECDAASEIVEETLAPYLDDITRRLALGMTASAHQTAAGVLAGLHACDGEHGGDSLLGYASEIQNYAYSVFALLKKHRAPLPAALYEVACPNWMHLYNG
ncbi:hypothetical protein GCM10009682_56400 [Luedemannella flava]|uniref:Uncharacterized protein n=1 Tax=Luedemannella flava TaxID=349316 RepID=A0ABN2MKB3_9ACTN